MQQVGKMLLGKEILLESGTNELEILVFNVSGYTFGINVAKVREVLPAQPITRLANSHASVRGVFRLRERVITCVSLVDHLDIGACEGGESKIILADFNQIQTAFLVDSVERIHRMSWENILSIPQIEGLCDSAVTSLARCGKRLVVMLDFEMIMDQVTDHRFRTDAVENAHGLPRDELKLVMADDSPTVRQAIKTALQASGYHDCHFFHNGLAAWNYIEQKFAETNDAKLVADLVISDVEMPQVDGFHLTKRIKDHPQLKAIPVLLYSSIVTPDNHKKGLAVGADAQVAKPDLVRVVQAADDLLAKKFAAARANAAAAGALHLGDAPSTTLGKLQSLNPTGAPGGTLAAGAAAHARPDGAHAPKASWAAAVNAPAPGEAPARVATYEDAEHTTECTTVEATFRVELTSLVTSLLVVIDEVDSTGATPDHKRRVFRLIHTIKSAASVIPLPALVGVSHKMEDLLEHALEGGKAWPQEDLRNFADWVAELAALPLDAPRVEAQAAEFLSRLVST